MKYLCHLYVLTLTLHAILALYGEQRRDGISAQFKSKSSIDFIDAMFINNGITTVWVHVGSIILLSNVFFLTKWFMFKWLLYPLISQYFIVSAKNSEILLLNRFTKYI